MRAVVQRVSSASVLIGSETVGAIALGVLALIGVAHDDTEEDAAAVARKISGLRIFSDEAGDMNLALADAGGAVLAVSQFTLYGDARKGRRPSFVEAARPEIAQPLFDRVVTLLRRDGLDVATGVFGATMRVELCNEGPVTILIDSRKGF